MIKSSEPIYNEPIYYIVLLVFFFFLSRSALSINSGSGCNMCSACGIEACTRNLTYIVA